MFLLSFWTNRNLQTLQVTNEGNFASSCRRSSAEAESFLGCGIYGVESNIEITQLLIPTHAHFHWLKFIKNI